MSIIKYASSINEVTGTYPDIVPYKRWDYLSNLRNVDGVAYCRHESYATQENPTRHLIAGKNGTYKQPCPIDFKDFGFNIGTDDSIDKIVLHYKHQTFINNGYYPAFGGATVTLLGTSVASKKGIAVSGTLTEDTITFYGVSVNELNSSNFGVRFAYPANSNTTPGRIELSNFYLEVFTKLENLHLEIDSNFSKNPLIINEVGQATFKVKKEANMSYQSIIQITMPLGVKVEQVNSYDSNSSYTKTTQTLSGYSYDVIEWTVNFNASDTSWKTFNCNIKGYNTSDSINVTDTSRIKECRMVETVNNIVYVNKLTIKEIETVLSTNINGKVGKIVGNSNNFNVGIKTVDPFHSNKKIVFDFGSECTVSNINDIQALSKVSSAILTTSNNKSVLTINLNDSGGNLNLTIPVVVVFANDGTFTYNIKAYTSSDNRNIGNTLTGNYFVIPRSVGTLGFSRIEILDYWTENMADGITYIFGSNVKLEGNTNGFTPVNYGNNYRIGVFNEDSTYLSNSETFLEKVIWSNSIATDNFTEQTVLFEYDSNNPLYLVYADTYTGDPLREQIYFRFSEPLIVEATDYNNVTKIGHTLWPLYPLVNNGVGYSRVILYNNVSETIPVSISDWNDGGLFTQDISPLGFEVKVNYITSGDIMLQCEIYLDDEHIGTRDLTLRAGSGVATFGNKYDLFNLKATDFINNNFEFEVRIKILNTYTSEALVELNDVNVTMNYIDRIPCGYGVIVNGENSKDYGFMVKLIDPAFGTKNKKQDYNVSGTDKNIINRLNVDTKDIELEVIIPACRHPESIVLIDKMVELFTNERELRTNKPIPKDLIFEAVPDRRFPFVRVDQINGEYKGANYYAKIKLEIPSGTAYDIERTVTGPHGRASSNIVINPDIYYISNTNGELLINETFFEQEFLVQTSRIRQGSNIYIDTENRKIYLQDSNGNSDITEYVDYNSEWFKLKGEYAFTSETGTITSVEYYLRR